MNCQKCFRKIPYHKANCPELLVKTAAMTYDGQQIAHYSTYKKKGVIGLSKSKAKGRKTKA